MRKVMACVIAATTVLLMGAECRGSKPNPKKDTVIPKTTVVQICVDPVATVRFEDEACDNPDEGYVWRYISFDGDHQLPAVGERINPLRGTGVAPQDKTIRPIPGKGAVFAD